MFGICLGIKNLSRHKRRNFITILVIGFAFFGYLFVESMMNGLSQMSFQNIIDFETGTIQIANPEYWRKREELPLENMIIWKEELREELLKINGITGFSPELRFSAQLYNGIDEMAVKAVGIIPEEYNQVYKTQDYLLAGSFSTIGQNKVLIGDRLAELLDLKIHDFIVLLVRTKEATFNTIELEVGGIIRTPNPLINSNMVFLPLELVQKSLNVEQNITNISLKVSPGQENSVIKSLKYTFQEGKLPLDAYSWQDSAESIIIYSKMEKQAVGIIMSIVLLIGMLGIVNNIILSALERTSEIGMMKALGMKEWEIVVVFMVEACGIGLLGGMAGCLMGYFGVSWLVNSGFNFKALYGDWVNWADYGIPILDRIYGVWNGQTFGYILVLGVFVAILSSIIPSYWAANKDPVEAIYRK